VMQDETDPGVPNLDFVHYTSGWVLLSRTSVVRRDRSGTKQREKPGGKLVGLIELFVCPFVCPRRLKVIPFCSILCNLPINLSIDKDSKYEKFRSGGKGF